MEWEKWLCRAQQKHSAQKRRAKNLRGALCESVRAGSLEGLAESVGAGAEIDKADEWTRVTPLMLAAGLGWAPGVEYLLSAGAGAQARECMGQDALMIAAKGGDPECVRLLMARCCARAADKGGRTALMLALWHGKPDAARCLAQASDLAAVCLAGRSAMDYAMEGKDAGCVKVLLEAGWPGGAKEAASMAARSGLHEILAMAEAMDIGGEGLGARGQAKGCSKTL